MKWTGRAFPALLLAVLLLLPSCDSKDRQVHRVDFQTAPAYEAEDIALPVPTGDLLGCCTDGTSIYLLADEKNGEEVRSHLCRVDLAEGTAEELDGFQSVEPPEEGYKNTLGPILAPDGTLWLYETLSITRYDLPEDFDPEKEAVGKYYTGRDDFHHLRQLDPATGREKRLVDLSDAVRALEVSDIFDVAGFTVDGGGNIYFAGTGGVAALDKKGNYLFTLEADLPYRSTYNTAGNTLALLPDGTAALLTVQPGGKREVRTIDPAAKTWGKERYELPTGVDLLYGGTNGFLFYYTSGGALCAWEPEGEEGRLLLNWSAADLDGSVMCFAPRDGGELAALTITQKGSFQDEDYWYNTDIRLSMLSPTDKSPSEGKTKLVYGTIGTNSVMRSRIKQFNDSSDAYYIELRNYAGDGVETFDATRDVRDAALKLFSAEIASGRAPDIWDVSLPIDLYARKGLLEDLWPWIDGDPEISREDLMSHVLDCASVDGKLYKVFNSFSIDTLAARSEVVGDRSSWTLEEMLDYYEAMPEGSTLLGIGYGKEGTLYHLINYTIDQWIDWTTGECRFDSEEFKALLELCGSMEDDTSSFSEDPEKRSNLANGVDFREGRQLLYPALLDGVGDILHNEALAAGPQCLTDYATYLNENNIWGARVDDDGNWRDESALVCQALSMADSYRRSGRLIWNALSPAAVFGAVDGGGYVSYPGAPSRSGAGSCFALPHWAGGFANNQLGISASCQAKEGAWAYARQCLLPGGADSVKTEDVTYLSRGFPVNKADFDRLLEPRWFQYEDEDGNLEYVLDQEGNRIEEPQDVQPVPAHYADVEVSMVLYQLAPNEAQMERFWALYNATSCVQDTESDVLLIVTEQARPYFAGDKSLDETADLIQRRVNLYVNENR